MRFLKLAFSVFVVFFLVSCDLQLVANGEIDNELPANYENYFLVMVKDSSNNAEALAIGAPDVVEYNGAYIMVYAQGALAEDEGREAHKGSIGFAVSDDGINWKKQGSILNPSDTENWDDWFLDTPCLLIKDDKFYLYYFGDKDNEAPGASIGLAISDDLQTWVRYSEAVLLKGESGTWDSNWVESPTVQYNAQTQTFHMWYTGVDENWLVRTGHASSADGITWNKDVNNPVLRERNLDYSDYSVWDGSGAGVAAAYFMNNTYYLVYASQSIADTLAGNLYPKLGMATPLDGSSFTRTSNKALVGQTETGNQKNGPYNPSILFKNEKWHIWYETGYGFGLIKLNF